MKDFKISILLDQNNNWIRPYLEAELINKNKELKISYNSQDVYDQDIVFIIGYTKILNDEFLNKNGLNVVIHESDLPKGKGFAPVQWQILDGAKEITVCLLEATNKVDSGDILYKYKFELTGHELYDEIREKQAHASIKIISEFLKIYPNFKREKQIGVETFYPKRSAKDGELNIDKSIRCQFNLLRIGNNEQWPSFFYFEGKKYFIKIYSE